MKLIELLPLIEWLKVNVYEKIKYIPSIFIASVNPKKNKECISNTLEGALQGYSNCRMADLVSNFDMDLKDVKKAIDDLKREIKAYE